MYQTPDFADLLVLRKATGRQTYESRATFGQLQKSKEKTAQTMTMHGFATPKQRRCIFGEKAGNVGYLHLGCLRLLLFQSVAAKFGRS